MGLGMQIACLGFASPGEVERDAGAELVLLSRAASDILDCHLTVESYDDESGRRLHRARLDMVTCDFEVLPGPGMTAAEAGVAIHRAFEHAEQVLRQRTSGR
ncbi:hypothetical protein [Caballeronia sp. ATUFL_M2_KS44]|uniref:hypothetical protein n=1 Tax=Caballeronia sp. ATUFL_M2_KS44 TaxID=2921767 RepID=UPI002028D1E5|nr:hypothetical protein [Caballeronia sp. ATUFL_M2_KS44]